MKILIDADACPVTKITINMAKKYEKKVFVFFDSSHVFSDDYATVYILDKGFDSVDMALLNKTEEFDLVITQDYGLASLALLKNARVINQNGMEYNKENIDLLLNNRYINAKMRNSGKRTRGPKKREKKDDINFMFTLENILKNS